MARGLTEAEMTVQEVTVQCAVSTSEGNNTLQQRMRGNSAQHF